MSFLKDFSKRISETAKGAAKKSSDFMEITKVSMQMDKYQEEIETNLYEIGKILYEGYSEDTWVREKFGARFEEINFLKQQINNLNKEVVKLKNMLNCEKCKTEVEKGVRFCPNCGAKIVEEEENTVKKEEDCFTKCRVCSSENSPGAKNCSKCGAEI